MPISWSSSFHKFRGGGGGGSSHTSHERVFKLVRNAIGFPAKLRHAVLHWREFLLGLLTYTVCHCRQDPVFGWSLRP